MTLGEVLARTISFLKAKEVDGARWEAEALIAHGLGLERVQLYMKQDYPLSPEETGQLRELVRQRGLGTPLAYVIGQKGFYKSNFAVAPGVLIPRSDSEVLVEKLLELIPEDSEDVVMDWGSGSGCLGLSLLIERPNLKLIAVDAHAEPIRVTTLNTRQLGLEFRAHILQKPVEELTLADVSYFGNVPKHLIANPPYVAPGDKNLAEDVAAHEPHAALFSEDKGLWHLKAWILKALDFSSLENMMFEIGFDQAYPMTEFVAQNAPELDHKIHKDLGGQDRALSLRRKNSKKAAGGLHG